MTAAPSCAPSCAQVQAPWGGVDGGVRHLECEAINKAGCRETSEDFLL